MPKPRPSLEPSLELEPRSRPSSALSHKVFQLLPTPYWARFTFLGRLEGHWGVSKSPGIKSSHPGKRCLHFGNMFAIVNTSEDFYQYTTSLPTMASSFVLSGRHSVGSQQSPGGNKAFKIVKKDPQ